MFRPCSTPLSEQPTEYQQLAVIGSARAGADCSGWTHCGAAASSGAPPTPLPLPPAVVMAVLTASAFPESPARPPLFWLWCAHG